MNFIKLACLSLLLVALSFGSFRTSSQTKLNPILVCLGKEEFLIAKKKIHGPYHRLSLTRALINGFLTMNDLELKEKYLKIICDKSNFTPSVKFLKLLMIKGKRIFKNPPKKEESSDNIFQKVAMEDFMEKVPGIFFGYLSNLQSITPIPECLSSNIKEMAVLEQRFQYLEEDLGGQELLKEKKQIEKIFEAIGDFHKLINECEKEKERRKKEEKAKEKREQKLIQEGRKS